MMSSVPQPRAAVLTAMGRTAGSNKTRHATPMTPWVAPGAIGVDSDLAIL
jgi:hypothetical protein